MEFGRAHFERALFWGALLDNVTFVETHLDSAEFLGAEIYNAYFSRTYLSRAQFGGAYLDSVTFVSRADTGFISFGGATMDWVYLGFDSLQNTYLDRACLRRVFFNDRDTPRTASLKGADISLIDSGYASAIAAAELDKFTVLPDYLRQGDLRVGGQRWFWRILKLEEGSVIVFWDARDPASKVWARVWDTMSVYDTTLTDRQVRALFLSATGRTIRARDNTMWAVNMKPGQPNAVRLWEVGREQETYCKRMLADVDVPGRAELTPGEKETRLAGLVESCRNP